MIPGKTIAALNPAAAALDDAVGEGDAGLLVVFGGLAQALNNTLLPSAAEP
jgi:hypothetical protein